MGMTSKIWNSMHAYYLIFLAKNEIFVAKGKIWNIKFANSIRKWLSSGVNWTVSVITINVIWITQSELYENRGGFR